MFTEKILKPCVYCGDSGKVGLDRINNEKGYTEENSAPCCKTCNFMKKAMTKEEFINHIIRINDYSL